MTWDDLKQKMADVWGQIRGMPEPVQDLPMRSDPAHVIRTDGEAYRPVAVEDGARRVSVNGTVYLTTPAVLAAIQQAAGTEGGVTACLNACLRAGALVRAPEAEQSVTPDLAIRYVPSMAAPGKAHYGHERGLSR